MLNGLLLIVAMGSELLFFYKSKAEVDETHLILGCFTSEMAPPILIDDEGLRVIGGLNKPTPISTRIVTTKNGERQLEIGERLIGRPAAAGYVLDRDDRHGRYIALTSRLGPNYALTDMANFGGFVIPTDDDVQLNYTPTSLDECRVTD